MKRRSFLHRSLHAAALPGVLGQMGFGLAGNRSMEYLLRQAAESDRALVLIFLDGGNDGLNTVVPLDKMAELVHLRPKVVLRENQVLPLAGTDVGLHKELSGLRDLYNENRFQIIQNVGYPDQNFSHFRSTDIWMSGSSADTIESTGWMGRHLTEIFPDYPAAYPDNDMEDPLSVEIGYGSSLLFQGVSGSMSVTVNSVNSFYRLLDNTEQDAPDTLAGDKLRFLRLISRQSQVYGQRIVDVAKKIQSHAPYPTDNSLADQLKIISKLIAGGSRTPVYMVRIGGFDTHDAQVEEDHSEGVHAYLLKQVNDAITAFMGDLEFHGVQDKVLGMTFSEFGRTILSNASNGTDHGAAAPLFLFGNALKGGVLGSNPQLDFSMTYSDNLAYEFDFRQVYASVLEQWFGVDAGVRSSLLRSDFDTLEIIGDPVTIVSNEELEADTLSVYPNPLKLQASIRFYSPGGRVTVELMDINGRVVEKIYRGEPDGGIQNIQWNTGRLGRGKYFVIVQTQRGQEIHPVIK